MALSRLDIHQLRNLQHVRLQPGSYFNLLWGSNGAGKSSVLEAIHLLGRGSSFRGNDVRSLLSHGAERCLVSAKLEHSGVTIGTEFTRSELTYRIDGAAAANRAALSERLPVVFLGQESHRLLTEGPQQRRRFLDWGVFHVEPRFLMAWRRYQRALKQRNTALRHGQRLAPWDEELVKLATEITEFRGAYLNRLAPYVQYYLAALCELKDFTLKLFPGWRQDTTLAEALKHGLEQDKTFGYTRYGAHRADLVIKTDGRQAKEVVSRGQQKLLICALTLAQAMLVNENEATSCVVLIDDLAAELDPDHRLKLLALLAALGSQVFITATDTATSWGEMQTECRLFHVKQGTIDPSD